MLYLIVFRQAIERLLFKVITLNDVWYNHRECYLVYLIFKL